MAVWKRRKISITLRSDLCTGSGYSYAGVVDNDVCYDEAGLPYIPARRLKGCMREAADTILYAKYGTRAGKLFGTAGRSAYTGNHIEKESVQIGNAYPKQYAVLRAAVLEGRKRSACYDTHHILQRFTRVVGQTAMVDGVADEMTLRYTRVINQFAPWGEKQPMVFMADLFYDPADEEVLEDVIHATRHIGLKRNRGMGNVRIEWADVLPETASCDLIPGDKGFDDIRSGNSGSVEPEVLRHEADIVETKLPDRTVMLSFGIENIEPLVLSAEKEDESAACISGQSVLGAFAGRFLAEQDAESEIFRELFLSGKALFTNFYPYVRGKIHYPSAAYIRQLKKTKKYVYALEEVFSRDYRETAYDPSGGNQPKALKNQFVSLSGNRLSVCDVERDVVYHHRHHDESGNEEAAQLYGLEVIRAGQCFAGSVIVPEDRVKIMKQLILRSPYISFGKSRTAQYGTCRLIRTEPEDPSALAKTIPKGSTAVVTFLSDAVFCPDGGETAEGLYSVFYDDVREAVREELGIVEDTSRENRYLSILQTSVRMGYLGIWNLRKPAVPVVNAGSCLSFVLAEDFFTDKLFVGERNLEGFGQIRIHRAEDLTYDGIIDGINDGKEKLDAEQQDPEKEDPLLVCSPAPCVRELIQPVLIGNWLDRKILTGIKNNSIKAGITNTALGCIILMLRECVDEYPDRMDSGKMYLAFVKRIQSIKSDSARKEGREIAKIIGNPGADVSGSQIDDGSVQLKDLIGFSKEEPEFTELVRLGLKEPEINEAVKAVWHEYLMALLVDRKYKGGAGND